MQSPNDVLLIGYHQEPEQLLTRISNQLPDKSNKVIRPIRPGDIDNDTKSKDEKEEGNKPVPKSEQGKDYLSGDVKFIISIALGLVVIAVLVYLIPRVSSLCSILRPVIT